MLDLMTLGASMGLQTELNKVREETGAAVHQEETVEQTTATATPLAQAAEVVSGALEAVESAASELVSAIVPSSDMVSGVMENVSVQAPTVDLSLPTQRVAKK